MRLQRTSIKKILWWKIKLYMSMELHGINYDLCSFFNVSQQYFLYRKRSDRYTGMRPISAGVQTLAEI